MSLQKEGWAAASGEQRKPKGERVGKRKECHRITYSFIFIFLVENITYSLRRSTFSFILILLFCNSIDHHRQHGGLRFDDVLTSGAHEKGSIITNARGNWLGATSME